MITQAEYDTLYENLVKKHGREMVRIGALVDWMYIKTRGDKMGERQFKTLIDVAISALTAVDIDRQDLIAVTDDIAKLRQTVHYLNSIPE